MDGTNGWYRVNYSGRVGFGYAPYCSATSVLSGGYGFYQNYNPDVDLVMTSLYNTIHSEDATIRNFVHNNYEHVTWLNYKPNRIYNFSSPNIRTKPILLEFYASIGSQLKEGQNAELTIVYPNPVKDVLTISNKELTIESYKLYNSLGQLLRTEELSKNNQIDVSYLSSGLYILEVITKSKKTSIKFIKV